MKKAINTKPSYTQKQIRSILKQQSSVRKAQKRLLAYTNLIKCGSSYD